MEYKQRHKRLRLLIKKLNKERKKQAKQIDILCNDIISAQRGFIQKLNTINYTANFYESIIGTTDLNSLLSTASQLIKEKIGDANVCFFLRGIDGFEPHIFQDHGKTFTLTSGACAPTSKSCPSETFQKERFENCFSAELVEEICRQNKVCSIDDMFSMGLQGNLNELSKISAVTVPLGRFGLSLGFILIYRSKDVKITADQINDVCAVTYGLCRAIRFCQLLLRSAN